MRKQMRLGNNLPGQIQAQRESAKQGNSGHFLSSFSSFFPLTRGVGVKNLDAVSFLNGATALGRWRDESTIYLSLIT